MAIKYSIRFYKDQEVRAIWDEENSKWWFSVIDVIWILNNENDYTKNRNYRKYLKNKLKKEKSQVVSDTNQFKLMAPDEKLRLTDVLDSDWIILLAKNFPNNNASDFLDRFLYSENSVDWQSRKKAYALFENNLVQEEDIWTAKASTSKIWETGKVWIALVRFQNNFFNFIVIFLIKIHISYKRFIQLYNCFFCTNKIENLK